MELWVWFIDDEKLLFSGLLFLGVDKLWSWVVAGRVVLRLLTSRRFSKYPSCFLSKVFSALRPAFSI